MKYIVVTEVDANTKIPCTVEPMRTGPTMPIVDGLELDWADYSTWPVETKQGIYVRAPKYYGTCPDNANVEIDGVLEVLTETEWMQRKYNEFYARKPYPSWTWDSATMTWNCPVSYPQGADPTKYYWNEPTLSWIEVQ